VCSEVIKGNYQFLLVGYGAGPWCPGDAFCYCATGILDNDPAASVNDPAGSPAAQCSILTPFDSTGSSFHIFSTAEST